MTPRRAMPLVIALVTIAGGLTLTAPAQARTATGGQLYVLHGLPGVVADVQVDGRSIRRKVQAGSVVGPLTMSAGRHMVSLVAAGEPELTGSVTIANGGSVDVVAHLPAELNADPKLTAFPNNVSPVGRGKTRIAVAHTAQVPPADIRIDGKPLLRNVANAEVLTIEVPARAYKVDIVATGTTGPAVFGPVTLTVKPGTFTRVFAFGSPTEDTMNVLVQPLSVTQQGAAAPASVQTGTGGQMAALLAGR